MVVLQYCPGQKASMFISTGNVTQWDGNNKIVLCLHVKRMFDNMSIIFYLVLIS